MNLKVNMLNLTEGSIKHYLNLSKSSVFSEGRVAYTWKGDRVKGVSVILEVYTPGKYSLY